jgi:cellulose biosynthesis protein BcsQ
MGDSMKFLYKHHVRGFMIPYSVWNFKGGVGKSHTSLTLSGYLASQGKRVALVDYDPQNGAMICSDIAKANGSPLPFLVVKSLSEINRDEIDAVIFDHSQVSTLAVSLPLSLSFRLSLMQQAIQSLSRVFTNWTERTSSVSSFLIV